MQRLWNLGVLRAHQALFLIMLWSCRHADGPPRMHGHVMLLVAHLDSTQLP